MIKRGTFAAILGVFAASTFGAPAQDQTKPSTPELAPIQGLPWANPLDGKRIRALMIAPGIAQRELHMLEFHLEMDCTFFAVDDLKKPPSPNAKDAEKAPIRKLERDLADSPDLIIAAGPGFGTLPETTQHAVVQAVTAGTGLLLANHQTGLGPILEEALAGSVPVENFSEILAGVGQAATPEWKSGLDFVHGTSLGNGRIAELRYPAGPPAFDALLPPLIQPLSAEQDFPSIYISLIAKTARWAAKRDPEIRIQQLSRIGPKPPSESEIPPDLMKEFVEQATDISKFGPVEAFNVVLTGAAPESYHVRAQLRGIGRNSRRTLSPTSSLRKASSNYAIYFMGAPGQTLLDVWLLDGDRVVDWYTEVIDIPGWPRIQSVTLSKRFLVQNDSLDIVAALAENPGGSEPGAVYARATDTNGRIVSETRGALPVDAREARAHLEFVDLISNRVKVEIFLLKGDGAALSEISLEISSHGYAYLPVYRAAQTSPFTLAARMDVFAEYTLRSRLATLHANGFDSALTAPGNVAGLYASESGLDPIPSIALGGWKSGDGNTCAMSAARIRDEAMHLRDVVDLQWHCGQQRIAMSASSEFEKMCSGERVDDACAADFLAWLQHNYGQIETLRAVWPVQPATWADLSIPSIEEQSKAGNFAPLLDRHAYCRTALDLYAKQTKDAALRTIANARVGTAAFATADSLANDTADAGAMCVPFSTGALCGLRSTENDMPRLVALNSKSDSVAFSRWTPWLVGIHGGTGIVSTNALGPGNTPTESWLLNEEGTPNPATLALAESVAELRNGYDVLFHEAVPFDSKIAIYRNASSDSLAPWAPEHYDPVGSRDAFASLLENLGFACELLTTEGIAHGVPDRINVLVLPGVISLSDGEAIVIQKFIERGGALVADRLPGLYSDRGIRRSEPALAESFGVHWKSEGALTDSNYKRLSTAQEPLEFHGEIDTGVTLADATEPVCNLVNSEKRTALLNFNAQGGLPFSRTTDAKKTELSPSARQWRSDFLATLKEFGAAQAIETDLSKDHTGEFGFFKLTFGDATIVGAIRDPEGRDDSESVSFPLDPALSAYDVFHGEDVSGSKSFNAKLRPGHVAMVVQLPHKVRALELDVKDMCVIGQRLFYRASVQTKEGSSGTHILHVTLSTIMGVPLEHYSKTVVAAGGSAEDYIPLALNERPGDYQLSVRDVLTGSSATKRVQIVSNIGAPRVKKNFN